MPSISISPPKRRAVTTLNFDPSLFDFIRDILLLRFDEDLDPDSRALYQDFILRFQQITSPIMAKGVEDTAFYVGNRFISLNEVGGDPDHFGCSAAEFHRENLDRRRNWPLALIATSTHDTKRSEDIRQRLNVLSEIPDEWRRYLKRFTRITGKHRVPGPSGLLPDRNTEYFIYQTLLGVWPDYPVTAEQQPRFVERMWTHVQKAVREAKTHTSWLRPDKAYEAAVAQFLRAILRGGNYFLKVFRQLQARVSAFAKYNTLAAINLRLGAPGVLDNYQGSELWNYSSSIPITGGRSTSICAGICWAGCSVWSTAPRVRPRSPRNCCGRSGTAGSRSSPSGGGRISARGIANCFWTGSISPWRWRVSGRSM
jgi:(1->4)-alpha-D-glucan 1-alpha-D-glucosylmutase